MLSLSSMGDSGMTHITVTAKLMDGCSDEITATLPYLEWKIVSIPNLTPQSGMTELVYLSQVLSLPLNWPKTFGMCRWLFWSSSVGDNVELDQDNEPLISYPIHDHCNEYSESHQDNTVSDNPFNPVLGSV